MSTILQKQKGPAEAATSPSHGSTNPAKDMDMNTHSDTTTATGTARPSLYRLLADYWEKYDLLDLAMQETDATSSGTPEHEAAQIKQFEAGNRMDEAACAICAYVPVWQFEARIKAGFVAYLAKENCGGLDSEWASALIQSLPTLYAPKREALA